METMSSTPRSSFTPLAFYSFGIGIFTFLGLFIIQETQHLQWQANAIAIGFMTLSFLFLLHLKMIRPIQIVMREMKALLTGKSYKRILTARMDEVGLLAHFFNEVTRNLESISGDIKTHARIQKELDSAQDIQQMLIPKNAPVIPQLNVTAKTRPASEIGGDTFDFFFKDGRHILYIGDSTGHGIPAGIVMVMVDVLLETFIEIESTLLNMVIKLNKYLKSHLKPSMFMTMILMEWVPSEKTLKWIGAGHEHIIHVQTRKGIVNLIKAGGLAIGMLPNIENFVKENEIVLEEDDFVILYSDGIIEAKNVHGDLYTLNRLQKFLKEQAGVDVRTETLFEKIAIDVGRFMEGYKQLDDMTLIVMKHTQKSDQESRDTQWKA